jgi:hypothetical protein
MINVANVPHALSPFDFKTYFRRLRAIFLPVDVFQAFQPLGHNIVLHISDQRAFSELIRPENIRNQSENAPRVKRFHVDRMRYLAIPLQSVLFENLIAAVQLVYRM